jgi:hypothetical protein
LIILIIFFTRKGEKNVKKKDEKYIINNKFFKLNTDFLLTF